mgnify:CR=1 FL=1
MYYNYSALVKDLDKFFKGFKYKPDVIVAVSRGGLTISHLFASYLNVKEVLVVNASSYEGKTQGELEVKNIPNLSGYKKALLIDDISDTGETLKTINEALTSNNKKTEVKSFTIFYKEESKFKPDFYIRGAHNWVDFFWEVDLVKEKKQG